MRYLPIIGLCIGVGLGGVGCTGTGFVSSNNADGPGDSSTGDASGGGEDAYNSQPGDRNDAGLPGRDAGGLEPADAADGEDSGVPTPDDGGSGPGEEDGTGPGPTEPGPDTNEPPDEPPAPQPSVEFIKPESGANVDNPVAFKIAAEHVDTVQIKVDDWPLSDPWDPDTETSLSYEFTGTGTERTGVLYGYDASGAEIARDEVVFTVKAPPRPEKGTSIGSFVNTYYYLEDENDFSGSASSTLYDRNCAVIAKVPDDFANLACIEGSAKLKDGRVINYATATNCGGACGFTWSVMSSSFPWGMGSRNNALEPLRSWAVDTNVISYGTVLYVEEWDGMAIPAAGGVSAMTHDGCFRADDVGGGIEGNHVDIFTGSKAMYRALNTEFPTRTSFTVYKNSPRCSHL